MIAERAGEGLVRPVAPIERDGENVRGAGRERTRRLAETPRADILHDRAARRLAEGATEMEARDADRRRDFFEIDLSGEVALDIPERVADGVHGCFIIPPLLSSV
jgi:hypothetical protein